MKAKSGYIMDGMVNVEYVTTDGTQMWQSYYSPCEKGMQERNIPFDDLISNINFKNGVAEFSLSTFMGGVYSVDMFSVIQYRQEELNKNGYKTFVKEVNNWGDITRTWYVWSKEKTKYRKKSKNQAIILTSIGLLLLFLYLSVGILCP